MPFLVIFRRFEVWLLLAVVVALIVFAFRPEPSLPVDLADGNEERSEAPAPEKNPIDPVPSDSPEAPDLSDLKVSEVRVSESGEGRIVETVLSGRAPGTTDLLLDEAGVTASTEGGARVDRFFEPFLVSPRLLASEDSLATLRWWVEGPAEVIWLEVQGRRLRAELP